MTAITKRDESVAAHGARWVTLAFVRVGLSNYGYAVLLTRLLRVSAYSVFSAGQGLILSATTVATVSIPWVLAQALARAHNDEERNGAARFAMLASVGSGLIAAAVVGIVASSVRGSADGDSRWPSARSSSFWAPLPPAGCRAGNVCVRFPPSTSAENLVKNCAGVVLVMVAGLRETGALAAFGIGGVVMLCGGRVLRAAQADCGGGARRPRSVAPRLPHSLGQGMVSLFLAIDVVLVALLPGDHALAASYQASAALARVPLYMAAAVATAFFPSLSRRATGGMIAARAVRMYTAVAVPFAVVLATIPAPILALVLPAQYGAVATLLRYTAITGLAAGGISLVTAFFQAADDYSCLWWLGAGLVGYTGALLDGLAGRRHHRTGRRRRARRCSRAGTGDLPPGAPPGAQRTRLGPPSGARGGSRGAGGTTAALWLWLAAATLIGIRAAARFVRPGARHARGPRWAGSGHPRTEGEPAVSLLVDTVWRGIAPKTTDTELHRALDLARRNRVEGRLACAYPAQLTGVLAEVRIAHALFVRNLSQVVDRLQGAGIRAMLIKVGLPGDHIDTSINLVIPERDWHRALAALANWHVYSSTYQLERSTTALLYPSDGPGLHLHTGVSWFGVPVFATGRLLARSRRSRSGLLIPARPDYLRIWLAQALFQDLVLDLSKLLAVRNLLHPAVITAARAEASREGWRAGFDDALTAAGGAIDRLDRGFPVSLPIPMPVLQSLGTRAEHADRWHQRERPGPVGQRRRCDNTQATRITTAGARPWSR